MDEVDLGASEGVALRENQADIKFTDYSLYVDRKLNDYIENVCEENDQIIESVNIDEFNKYWWRNFI